MINSSDLNNALIIVQKAHLEFSGEQTMCSGDLSIAMILHQYRQGVIPESYARKHIKKLIANGYASKDMILLCNKEFEMKEEKQ